MKTYKIKDVEVSEEQVRQLIKDNPELRYQFIFHTVKESTHKSKFFEPKDGGLAYYLSYADFKYSNNWDSPLDKAVIARGVYRTKEEAEKADQKRMALVRLWNWADKNAPFTPDWENTGQRKYYVDGYRHYLNKFDVESSTHFQTNFTLPHFKKLDDVERFIKECEADLRIYCL